MNEWQFPMTTEKLGGQDFWDCQAKKYWIQAMPLYYNFLNFLDPIL
jgi:hypothetical protein